MSLKELQQLISPNLNQEVLNNIIRRKTGWKDVHVKNIIINNEESKKGDSYLSTITRFKVEASGKLEGDVAESTIIIAVIAKAIPKNVARKKTFRSNDFFSNEITFYETVWSVLHDFVVSKNVNKGYEDILPLCLAAVSDGKTDFIALEDASYSGFQSIDRSCGLDLAHTELIIKCFAIFNGISLAYKMQNPEKFSKIVGQLKETYFHENFRNWYIKFQENLIGTIRDCVEKQLPSVYLKKYDDLTTGDFFSVLCQLCARETPLSVVSQGDAWVPNFLIKYENGNPKTPLMIDFQLARYSSLGLDLIFFLYSCTEQNLREECLDKLLELYHQTLQSVLRDLGSDPNVVKFEDIKREVKEAGRFGVGMSMEAIVMSLMDDDDVADIDGLQGEEAAPLETVWILRPFKSEAKRQRIADIIKHAVDNEFI